MKRDKKLSVLTMAIQNLKAKKFRTAFMMFFVVLMSATFFFSRLLMDNLKLGIENTTRRMGADMIIVPKEGTEEIRESLFSGTPCSIFFDRKWAEDVKKVEGVEKVSPQLYLNTLPAACCDEEVQLIAFEPETDFVVRPWISSLDKLKLKTGEVIVGANIFSDVGQKVNFYETEFLVAAKLEKSGMGYDNSVFMTYETAYLLKNSEMARRNLPTAELEEVASMLMVDISNDMKGAKQAKLRVDIRNAGTTDEKMSAYTADDLMSGITSQVERLSGYGGVLTYIMLISTALALISIFSITINERKYEFGILYTLGAKKSNITYIILFEALIISVVGGIIGVLGAAYGVSIFKDLISTKLDIPYFNNGIEQVIPVAIICLLIAIFTGVIAAACSSYRISKEEAYHLIRENE